MATLLPEGRPSRLAVALSGGGDSTALLALTRDWLGPDGNLDAVIVDHALRDGSAEEARQAAQMASDLGALPHILTLGTWDGQGNLQDHARQGRYAAIEDWMATRRDPPGAVLLGHTRDDQAETFLLRLARGSGVDGLAGMEACRISDRGTLFLRPLLGLGRDALRDWLRARGLHWIDDPSNDDPRFDRIRLRQALPMLADLGLTSDRLADTAQAMARAREALVARAVEAARMSVTDTGAWLVLDPAALGEIEDETRLRLLAEAVRYIGGAVYRPRLASVSALMQRVLAGAGGTLAGVCVTPCPGRVILHREYQAVWDLEQDADGVWDGIWRPLSPLPEGQKLAALGPHGLPQLPKGDRPLPAACLTALPAVWAGDALRAVPHLEWGDRGRKLARRDGHDFASFLFAH